MELAKIPSKGQITIPIEIRKKLGYIGTDISIKRTVIKYNTQINRNLVIFRK